MHVRSLLKQAGVTLYLGPCFRLAYFYAVSIAKYRPGYGTNYIKTSVNLAVSIKSLLLKLWNRLGGQEKMGTMTYLVLIFRNANLFYSIDW